MPREPDCDTNVFSGAIQHVRMSPTQTTHRAALTARLIRIRLIGSYGSAAQQSEGKEPRSTVDEAAAVPSRPVAMNCFPAVSVL